MTAKTIAQDLAEHRALVLIRVSSDQQDLLRQKRDMQSFEARGMTIGRTVSLKGVSGTATLGHQEVDSLLADLDSPDVTALALSSLDRLLRPAMDFAQFGMLQVIRNAGKVIISAREGVLDPSNPEHFERLASAATRAGQELITLRQRSLDQRRALAEMGIICGGTPPFGYKLLGRKETGQARNGKWVIVEEEAQWVRQAFAWRAARMPLYTIAARLNEAGVRGKGTNGKPPEPWSNQTLRQMMARRSYIGEYVWSGITIAVPRIIDDEMFFAVAALAGTDVRLAADVRAQWNGRPSKNYLFRGFLVCGHCGKRCHGVHASSDRGGTRGYHCGWKSRSAPQRWLCPEPVAAGRDEVDAAGWSAIWALLSNPRRLYEIGREHFEPKGEQRRAATLPQKIAALRKREKNMQQAMRDGVFDTDREYQKTLETLQTVRSQIRALEQELAEAGNVVEFPPLAELERAIADLADPRYQPSDFDGRRGILERLLRLQVTLRAERVLEITGEVPIALPASATGSGLQNTNRGQCGAKRFVAAIPFNLKVVIPAA